MIKKLLFVGVIAIGTISAVAQFPDYKIQEGESILVGSPSDFQTKGANKIQRQDKRD